MKAATNELNVELYAFGSARGGREYQQQQKTDFPSLIYVYECTERIVKICKSRWISHRIITILFTLNLKQF